MDRSPVRFLRLTPHRHNASGHLYLGQRRKETVPVVFDMLFEYISCQMGEFWNMFKQCLSFISPNQWCEDIAQ